MLPKTIELLAKCLCEIALENDSIPEDLDDWEALSCLSEGTDIFEEYEGVGEDEHRSTEGISFRSKGLSE